ncbi:hypothetical protein LguiA_011154 [Lonicera macranthoides]
MATVVAKMMLGCGVDGSVSLHDVEIERRPYHRNYSCALHKSKGKFSNACSHHRNVSFTKKKSWNDCSLFVEASKLYSQSSSLSDTSFRDREDTKEALSSRWQKDQLC